MKVLIAHNFYRSTSPSGEDSVFRNEKALLSNNGVAVVPYEVFNDKIDTSSFAHRARLGLNTAWSNDTYDALSRLIEQTKPDIAHFYNTFPQISPSAYAACRNNGVPVVQTVQNYRFVCPNGFLLRGGKPCEDCFGTNFFPAIRYRCYRGSVLATSAVVWGLLSNRWRGTYNHHVNRYIAPTRFAASKLVEGGLPKSCMEVKPNFIPIPPEPGMGTGGYALFAGRLSSEKGLHTLLEAWKGVKGLPLKIAGDGPLRSELQSFAAARELPIEFLGSVSYAEVLELTRNAICLVVPSEWYEGFPMVVVQALACGTPVIASRLGSLEEIIQEGETGLQFTAGDATDLARTVKQLLGDPAHLSVMRKNTRAEFLANYTPERNFQLLIDIYRQTIEGRSIVSSDPAAVL